MREIPLTKNMLAMVDDEDFDTLSKHKWCATVGPWTTYALRSNGSIGGKRQTMPMHRQIMSCPAGKVVDHIDGNGLNNQKSNLRIVPHQHNGFNRVTLNRNNSSGVRGVQKEGDRWKARVFFAGVDYRLGTFDSVAEAAHARAEAEAACRFGLAVSCMDFRRQ